MFEKLSQDPLKNKGVSNQETFSVNNETDEEKTERFQKDLDEKLKIFYETLGDKAKEEKGKLFSAMSDVWGELVLEIRNRYNSPDKTNMES